MASTVHNVSPSGLAASQPGLPACRPVMRDPKGTLRPRQSLRPTVLVVEDDTISRDSLAAALLDLEADIITAADGSEAIDKLRSGDVTVVVSDLIMRDVDGFALLQHVKQYYPRTAFILVTAYDGALQPARAMAKGAYGYMAKPIDLPRLEKLIRQACQEAFPA